MRTIFLILRWTGLYLVLIGFTSLEAKGGLARVLIDSWADEEYVANKEKEDGARYETYHFLKGRHFSGYLRDNSLGKVEFGDMVEVLAKEMRERNYYTARVPEQGDFLIIVHWGVTGIQDSFEELFPDAQFGDFEEAEALDDNELLDSDRFTYRKSENARLIGFDRAITRKGLSIQNENELRDMLDEERYFMVLLAYDWQKLRLNNERKLIWYTRFSLRAVSTNFEEAHFALSRGASQYFGTNLDGKLGRARVNLGPGEVTKSELEVVDEIEDESTSEK